MNPPDRRLSASLAKPCRPPSLSCRRRGGRAGLSEPTGPIASRSRLDGTGVPNDGSTEAIKNVVETGGQTISNEGSALTRSHQPRHAETQVEASVKSQGAPPQIDPGLR